MGILDKNGVSVVNYEYDAWGKLLDCTGMMAATLGADNPFRYRGYVYDEEIGLYYLQSRYYNPWWGRFINADEVDSTDSEIFSENKYAYCNNDPTVQEDSIGSIGHLAIGALVGAVTGFVGQIVSDVITSACEGKVTVSSWQTYVGATIGGAVGGAVFAATGGNPNLATKASCAVSGAVTTFVGGALEKVTNRDYDQSWSDIMANTAIDAGAGLILAGVSLKVPHVTKGRQSMSAVYKQGLTNLRKQTIHHVSAKVVGKGIASLAVSGLAMDVYYGVKMPICKNFKYTLASRHSVKPSSMRKQSAYYMAR